MTDIDLTLLNQEEATWGQYLINLILMNIIFLMAYLNRKKSYPVQATWIATLIFCLVAYWDTDYFSFRQIFFTELKDFRDPLYTYLGAISFNSYTIFRLIIWGSALYLFKKTIDRFEISRNIAIYIFTIFFLLTFSYARVSLGMAMYFYGLSFIIKPNQYNRFWSIAFGLIFIGCSYFGHRSLMAPILLTPLAFIKLNKKVFIAIVIIGLVASNLASNLISELIAGTMQLSNNFGGAGEAAEHYANIEVEMEYNWKFTLMRYLRFSSFYITMAYITWKIAFSADSKLISNNIKRLATISLGILIFAVSFMLLPTWGAEIIGYRYLYMLGIPVCIILSYFGTNKISKPRTIFILLILALMYSEGFILGKVLSL